MTRVEWARFYSTLRKRVRQGFGAIHFHSSFNAAMNQAVDWRRRVELWINGTEKRIWSLAVDLYYPF